jgi:predicted transglutaminase-like protease
MTPEEMRKRLKQFALRRIKLAVSFPKGPPGDETASWKRFYEERIDRFLSGKFRRQYEEELVKEFRNYLPCVPPWKR